VANRHRPGGSLTMPSGLPKPAAATAPTCRSTNRCCPTR
jgi:hypothetical protein